MAKIGGISVRELNRMEENFLLTINFNLAVSTEQYQQFTGWIMGQVSPINNENNFT